MIKCVRIICTGKITKAFVEVLQKQARKLGVEGILHQVPPDSVRLIACGSIDSIESFVDFLYKEGAAKKPFSIEVEPFLKDKDYRGVFRIIA